MNVIDFVMDYEDGNVTEEEIVEGFQALIDSGAAWTLQGHYGRTAVALIEAGLCHEPGSSIEELRAEDAVDARYEDGDEV